MTASERREQILEVARRSFAECGYQNSTTAKIAKAAGISEPVLYQHFESKMALFHAILEATLDESRQHFDSFQGECRNGAEKILALAVDFPRYCEQNRARFRVIERALASVEDDTTKGLLACYYENVVKSVAELVQLGRDDGTIRSDVAPESLAWIFVMNGIGFCMLSGLSPTGVVNKGFGDDLREIVRGMLDYRTS